MPTKDRLLQNRVLLSVLLLFGILSSAFHMGNLSAVSGLSPVLNLMRMHPPGKFYSNSYSRHAPPTWQLNNASSPSLDGNSLRCAITGGQPYSNVHCYRNLLLTLAVIFHL